MKNMLHNVSNVSSTNLGKCYLLPIKAACYIAMKWGGGEKQERGEQRRLRWLFYNFITGFPGLEELNKMRHFNKKLLNTTMNTSLTTSYSLLKPKWSLSSREIDFFSPLGDFYTFNIWWSSEHWNINPVMYIFSIVHGDGWVIFRLHPDGNLPGSPPHSLRRLQRQ